jgi:hypothetical protein
VVTAALSGVAGIAIGMLAIPLSSYVIAPMWRGGKGLFRRAKPA